MHIRKKLNPKLTQSTRWRRRRANLDGLGVGEDSLDKRAGDQAGGNEAQHCTTAALRLGWSLLSSNAEPRACDHHPAAAGDSAAQAG